ncbi:VOC family protein [Streptomyces sp. 8N706]|uniref:VOC family protein n=1 Tax=Streptomyces sp. 8N706 TaxID=3457416 RepID=UPI003FD620F5
MPGAEGKIVMELAVVLDCAHPRSLAAFWTEALGYRVVSTHPPFVRLTDPGRRGPEVLLQQVPEQKVGKNRMHLDLRVPEIGPELSRLRELGARVLREPFDDRGWLTAVLADPEGNEFCLIVPVV